MDRRDRQTKDVSTEASRRCTHERWRTAIGGGGACSASGHAGQRRGTVFKFEVRAVMDQPCRREALNLSMNVEESDPLPRDCASGSSVLPVAVSAVCPVLPPTARQEVSIRVTSVQRTDSSPLPVDVL